MMIIDGNGNLHDGVGRFSEKENSQPAAELTDVQTESPEFKAARKAFVDAEWAFRDAAMAEIRRRMPDGVDAVVFFINDTPRLSVFDMLDADGESVLDEYESSDAFEAIDTIAAELGVRDAEDADAFLIEIGDDRFVISRDETGVQ